MGALRCTGVECPLCALGIKPQRTIYLPMKRWVEDAEGNGTFVPTTPLPVREGSELYRIVEDLQAKGVTFK